MPQSNRGFALSKMNKDADERTVQDGEYRDALNIQISSSDGSNVGSAQTLLGNTLLSADMVPAGSTCVGSIAHNKEDKIYYFVAGPKVSPSDYSTEGAWRDYIIEYDVKSGGFKYVFVDIYESHFTTSADSVDRHIPVTFGAANPISHVRYNMVVEGYDATGLQVVTPDPRGQVTVSKREQTAAGVGKISIFSTYVDYNSVSIPANTHLVFKAKRLLNFDPDRLITGINIVDGMLFWTDNFSEPKKINIERSIGGTGGYIDINPNLQLFNGDNYYYHTRLCVTPDKGVPLRTEPRTGDGTTGYPWYVKEENITVIRKAPISPPLLEMSKSADGRKIGEIDQEVASMTQSGTTGITGTAQTAIGNFNSLMVNPLGSSPNYVKKPGMAITGVNVDTPVYWKVGDMILFNQEQEIHSAEGFTDHDVRATITSSPCLPLSNPSVAPSTGPFDFLIQSIDKDAIDEEQKTWNLRLEGKKPLFEMKFVRFAYRYKYEDGEYSTFSPWSEPAFIPGEYDYLPKKAYNLGMTNRLKQLKITNYLVEPSLRPQDVIQVDLLYKDESSPNIYTVESIKKTDGWGVTDTALVWPDPLQNWPLDASSLSSSDPDYVDDLHRGEYEVTTELIHKVVPSNQLLRQWDNVPRMALGQEVSSNRLVYGNYVQNFDIKSKYIETEIKPKILLTLGTKDAQLNDPDIDAEENSFSVGGEEGNLEGFIKGDRTCRSLRTYQVGVVYGDEYGRETPVLSGDGGSGTLTIPIENSSTLNSLNARIVTNAPDFAYYYKFFVKETSNEYYNMAMDRWYNAEDGNIWLSFASADRNKLDIEHHIVLKKAHDTHKPVTDLARYKVIAIENSAPKFIKTNVKVYGEAKNNNITRNSAGTITGGGTDIGTSSMGFPFDHYDKIWVRVLANGMSDVENAWGVGAGGGFEAGEGSITDKIGAGTFHLRIRTASIQSDWYQVNTYEKTDDWHKFKLDKIFKEDTAFATSNGSWSGRIDDLRIEFANHQIEEKPEFEGRFFVKINKDLILQKWLLGTRKKTYRVLNAREMRYWNFPTSVANDVYGNYVNWESTALNNWGELNVNFSGPNPFAPNGDIVMSNFDTGLGGNNGQARKCFFYAARGGAVDCDNYSAAGCSGTQGTKKWMRASWGKFYIDARWVRGAQKCCACYNRNWCNCNSVICGTGRQFLDERCNTEGSKGRGMFNNNMSMDIGYVYQGGRSWSAPEDETFYKLITTQGTTFKFREDKDEIIYKVTSAVNANHRDRHEGRHHNYDSREDRDEGNNAIRFRVNFESVEMPGVGLGPNNGTPSGYNIVGAQDTTAESGVKELGWWAGRELGVNHYMNDGANNSGNDSRKVPTPTDYTNATTRPGASAASNPKIDGTTPTTGNDQVRRYRQHPSKFHMIEIVEEIPDDGDWSSENPAVWETEPKEDVGMDIYYEASQAYPTRIDAATNELFAPIGSLVERDYGNNVPVGTTVVSWSDNKVRLSNNLEVKSGDRYRFYRPDGSYSTAINYEAPGYPYPAVSPLTGAGSVDYLTIRAHNQAAQPGNGGVYADAPHNQLQRLSWFNAYAWGNGVESDRIRDDYNAVTLTNGVKASTILAEQYKEERRKSGLIHSGIYNSTSGINRLNQFIAAEKITKDMNPQYGSIQKLHTRDNNIVVMHEDKIMKVLANKDALYNADQSKNVVVSAKFLGSDEPFSTRYGISTNPESFATDLTGRVYFADRTRSAVLRLSNDGITNISDYGMKDWFNDNLNPQTERILGSFDQKKGLYNLTIYGSRYQADDDNDNNDNSNGAGCGCVNENGTLDLTLAQNGSIEKYARTLSFSENSKGWISFKSFIPEGGLSINNEYYTFSEGEIFQHHSNPIRNRFYGVDNESSLSVIFNDDPGAVKSFSGLNYEGTQARITPMPAGSNDGDYYNLNPQDGWYVEDVITNLQTAGNLEFKNKEGKYFSRIKGETTTLGNLDEREFSVQGIGTANSISVSGGGEPVLRSNCLNITPAIDCNEIGGCTDAQATNYDNNATYDDGSCEYEVECHITLTQHATSTMYSNSWYVPPTQFSGYPGPSNPKVLCHIVGTSFPYTITPIATTNAWSGSNIWFEFVSGMPYTPGQTVTYGPWTPGTAQPSMTFGGSGTYMDAFIFGADNPGTYYFEVEDGSGCTEVFSIEIEEASTQSAGPANCEMTGELDPTASGAVLLQYSNGVPHVWNDDYNHNHATSTGSHFVTLDNNVIRTPNYDNNNYSGPYLPWYDATTGYSPAILSSVHEHRIVKDFPTFDLRDQHLWLYQNNGSYTFRWTRVARWQTHPGPIDQNTYLGEAYKYAISMWPTLSPWHATTGTTMPSNGTTWTAPNGTVYQEGITTSWEEYVNINTDYSNTSSQCNAYGNWAEAKIQLYSYEQVLIFIKLIGEYCLLNHNQQFPGTDPDNRLRLFQFLANVDLSTPFYGPAWRAPNGDPGIGGSGDTVYAIDGALQEAFKDDDRYGKPTTWDCFIEDIYYICKCEDPYTDPVTGDTYTCDYMPPNYYASEFLPNYLNTLP